MYPSFEEIDAQIKKVEMYNAIYQQQYDQIVQKMKVCAEELKLLVDIKELVKQKKQLYAKK